MLWKYQYATNWYLFMGASLWLHHIPVQVKSNWLLQSSSYLVSQSLGHLEALLSWAKSGPAIMGGDPDAQTSVALGGVQFSPGQFTFFAGSSSTFSL